MSNAILADRLLKKPTINGSAFVQCLSTCTGWLLMSNFFVCSRLHRLALILAVSDCLLQCISIPETPSVIQDGETQKDPFMDVDEWKSHLLFESDTDTIFCQKKTDIVHY